MAEQSLDELKKRYPYVSSSIAETFFAIEANQAQWKKSNLHAKEGHDRLLTVNYGQNYEFPQGQLQNGDCSTEAPKMERIVIVTGTTGAGKSATANTLLGRKWFDESSAAVSKTTSESGTCQDTRTLVVDTPRSWETAESMHREPVPVFYVFVINIACPRFTQHDLDMVRNIEYPGKGTVVDSGRCIAVLTHADSALQRMTLGEYMSEIKGDLLHTFLTKVMGGRCLAVNNSADTAYERGQHQKAILSSILKLQRPPPTPRKPVYDPVKHGGPSHIPTPPRHDPSEPNTSNTLQTNQGIAGNTNAAPVQQKTDPLGGIPTVTVPKQKPIAKSTSVMLGGKENPQVDHVRGETEINGALQGKGDKVNSEVKEVRQEVGPPNSIDKDCVHSANLEAVVTEDAANKTLDHTFGSSKKAMTPVESNHKGNGQSNTPFGERHTVTSTEQEGIGNMQPTATADAATGNSAGETRWKAKQEPKDKPKTTMDTGMETLSNSSSPAEATRVAGMERHQGHTEERCKGMYLEKKSLSDCTLDCEDTEKCQNEDEVLNTSVGESGSIGATVSGKSCTGGMLQPMDQRNSSKIPPVKTAEETWMPDDINSGQCPDGPVSQRDEVELTNIQHSNCCLYRCTTLLGMKIKEHKQIMENLLLKKKNLTLKKELLKIRLEKEGQIKGKDKE